jgi:hypothetical protein
MHLGWTSAQGNVPFDLISLFLLTLWQIINRWKRAQTLHSLRKPRFPHLLTLYWDNGANQIRREDHSGLLEGS